MNKFDLSLWSFWIAIAAGGGGIGLLCYWLFRRRDRTVYVAPQSASYYTGNPYVRPNATLGAPSYPASYAPAYPTGSAVPPAAVARTGMGVGGAIAAGAAGAVGGALLADALHRRNSEPLSETSAQKPKYEESPYDFSKPKDDIGYSSGETPSYDSGSGSSE